MKTDDVAQVRDAIAAIPAAKLRSYVSYWSSLVPQGCRQVYDRWLFAWCSVNQPWKNNVALYRALQELPVVPRTSQIEEVITATRVGLRGRARLLADFARRYWDRPADFTVGDGEDLRSARDRLLLLLASSSLTGLGVAKVSFVLEMLRPLSCEIVCVDRHVARWFGVTSRRVRSLSTGDYHRVEDAFVGLCAKKKLYAPVVRHVLCHVLWDARENRSDTSYWSWVFHAGIAA